MTLVEAIVIMLMIAQIFAATRVTKTVGAELCAAKTSNAPEGATSEAETKPEIGSV